MYSMGDDGLYINMYGGNTLSAKMKDGSPIKLEQVTNYPWDGKIVITINEITAKQTSIFLRIPGWCRNAAIKINGKPILQTIKLNAYNELERAWKAGDKIELNLDMLATLLESNPLVEETKNQVTIKRGPVVYCLESVDLPGQNVFDVVIPASIKLQPLPMKIDNGNIMALTGDAKLLENNEWKNKLYKEVNTTTKPVKIKLIPYYAWANRGKTDMTVWMPLMR